MQFANDLLLEHKRKTIAESLGFKVEADKDNVVNINGKNIKLKGNDILINVGTWNVSDMSYSILAKNGIDEKTILHMVM